MNFIAWVGSGEPTPFPKNSSIFSWPTLSVQDAAFRVHFGDEGTTKNKQGIHSSPYRDPRLFSMRGKTEALCINCHRDGNTSGWMDC